MSSSVDQPTPTPANDWRLHEHVAETAKLQAQKLVDELGSAALAKQAVEAVGEAVSSITSEERQLALAKALGFEDVNTMQQASEPVASNDGHQWFLTHVSETCWAVWSDFNHQSERQFSNRNEALASVPHDATLTGTSLLG